MAKKNVKDKDNNKGGWWVHHQERRLYDKKGGYDIFSWINSTIIIVISMINIYLLYLYLLLSISSCIFCHRNCNRRNCHRRPPLYYYHSVDVVFFLLFISLFNCICICIRFFSVVSSSSSSSYSCFRIVVITVTIIISSSSSSFPVSTSTYSPLPYYRFIFLLSFIHSMNFFILNHWYDWFISWDELNWK